MQIPSQDNHLLAVLAALRGYPALSDFSSSRDTWLVIFSLIIVGLASHAFYNLYLHPLAKFRGPRLAALSHLWLYFNSRDGKLEQKLEILRQKYQTNVLRIAPSELHISDPRVYHEIYTQNTEFMKDGAFYETFTQRHNIFTEVDKEFHRQHRKALNPAFSKSNIVSLQPLLASKIDAFCQKLSQLGDRRPVNLMNGFRCLTVDIITVFAFGNCFNLLDEAKDATFHTPFVHAFDEVMELTQVFYHFPAVRWLLATAVPNFLGWFGVTISSVDMFFQDTKKMALDFQSAPPSRKPGTGKPFLEASVGLSPYEFVGQARAILIAGSDTTAITLSNALYYICNNQAIKDKLVTVLDEFSNLRDGKMDLLSLEKIPYLVACVKEALRIAMPVQGRLPRVVPEPQRGKPAFAVDGHVVPPKTVVSMSAYTIHYDETIWGSDARSFVPERWLKPEATELERFLVTFSKGKRACIGINLANAEITMTLAKMFLSFDIQVDPSCTAETIQGMDRFTKAYNKDGIRFKIAKRAGDHPAVKFA